MNLYFILACDDDEFKAITIDNIDLRTARRRRISDYATSEELKNIIKEIEGTFSNMGRCSKSYG